MPLADIAGCIIFEWFNINEALFLHFQILKDLLDL